MAVLCGWCRWLRETVLKEGLIESGSKAIESGASGIGDGRFGDTDGQPGEEFARFGGTDAYQNFDGAQIALSAGIQFYLAGWDRHVRSKALLKQGDGLQRSSDESAMSAKGFAKIF